MEIITELKAKLRDAQEKLNELNEAHRAATTEVNDAAREFSVNNTPDNATKLSDASDKQGRVHNERAEAQTECNTIEERIRKEYEMLLDQTPRTNERRSIAPMPQVDQPQQVQVQGAQLNTIPAFNGETSDVEGWLSIIERAEEQFKWSDTQTAAAVKSKFTGRAAIWLRATEKFDKAGIMSWNRHPTCFRSMIVNKYMPGDVEQVAVKAMSDLNQRPNEDVSDFFDRVVLAVDKMNHNFTDEQKKERMYKVTFETQIRTFYAAGLKEEIRQVVLGGNNPPDSMEALKRQAVATEMNLVKNPKPKLVFEAEKVEEPTGEKKFELKEIQEIVEVIMKERKEKFDYSKVRCYQCNNMGHYANRCPNRQYGRGRGRWSRGYRGNSRGRGRGQQNRNNSEVETYQSGN